jgi:hypothetical protein
MAKLAISPNGIVFMAKSLSSTCWRSAAVAEFIVNWNRKCCGGLRQ